MADWRTISDTEVDPDAPVTSELAYAFRDNVIAMAEGASGAPRIDSISAMSHQGQAMAIGTYIFAFRNVTGNDFVNTGTVVQGSTLRPTNAQAYVSPGSPPPVLSGSWRCMGYVATSAVGDPNTYKATLWLRVS